MTRRTTRRVLISDADDSMADEAAAVIEFLASDTASYLFGVVIPVDGGWTLGG